MDIRQLECFMYLAENLNFSTTAQMMYISQPAVSGQIRSLEAELGIKLFKRTKRSVALTPAGESYYKDIIGVLELLNQAMIRAKHQAERYSSKFVIAYEDNLLAVKYLSNMVCEFRKLHPEIFLELKATSFRDKNQLYLDTKVDFMFSVNDGLDRLPDIAYKELYIGSFVCVMPQNHILSAHSAVSLETLSKHDLILLNPADAPEEMLRMIKKVERTCENAPKLYCDSVFSGYTLVKSGFGIAIMPDFVCLECSDVVTVPLSSDDHISYGIAWNKNNKGKAVQDIIAVAEKIYPPVVAAEK